MAKPRLNPDQLPMGFIVPTTDWVAPTAPPDLVAMGVRVVCLDTENRDDGLAAGRGPGWAHGSGYVAGIAAAWEGGSVYLPLRHPDTPCLDRGVVGDWLRGLIRAGVRIVCQNAGYDLGWLWTEFNIPPPETVEDTVAMAVMLDENRLSYDLDSLCRWQGVPGKDDRLLMEAGLAHGIGRTRTEVMSNLWRLPARFVGPYGAQDAVSTLGLWQRMQAPLHDQNLEEAYRLECDIIPMVTAMRRRGIRIDVDQADRVQQAFYAKRDEALAVMSRQLTIGRAVTINDCLSPIFLEKAFQAEQIPFPRTPKTNQGSFQSDWLEEQSHWLPQSVAVARRYQDAAEKFIGNYILSYTHRGRVHANVHAHKTDDGGTRSHRFSYSDPPLQQMPSPKRDKEIGLACRTCFLPDEGEEWCQIDYSQQEYRLIVHFAAEVGIEKASEAVALYQADSRTDFHKLVMDWTGLSRPEAKDANFAKAYGAGVPKFAAMIGRSRAEAEEIYKRYDDNLPFVSGLGKRCTARAAAKGFIRLIDGARCHFDRWEPGWGYEGRYEAPRSHDEAIRLTQTEGHPWYGVTLRRAFTHKAMNRLIQGSAARQTKLAMRAIWREGVVPLLQLHDELDFSVPSRDQVPMLKDIMCNVVPLQVPMLVEAGCGPSWGAADAEV